MKTQRKHVDSKYRNMNPTLSSLDGARTMKKEPSRLPLCLFVFVLAILSAGGAFAQPKGASNAKPTAPKAARATDARTPFTLSEYLGQVSDKHLGYKASDQTAKAAKLQAGEGSLVFKPNLFGNAVHQTYNRDNPFSTGDYTLIRTYSLGVAQQTPIGLTGRVTYNQFGLDAPSPVPGGPGLGYSAGWAQLELSASLMRNFNGEEFKAQRDAAESGAMAKSFQNSFLTKNVLLEAESIYWRLVLAREMVKVQKDAVDRAQRISEWTNRRVRLQLADRAENLQASTNLQARKLDLKSAEDEERAARQAFNSSRGVLGDTVPENLAELGPELIASMTVPERTTKRDDVRAAEFQARAASASARLSRERNKPTLELFGATPLTTPDDPPATIASTLPASARAATQIGIRLQAPLDFGTVAKVREGYDAEAQAADWSFQRKVFEEERDWEDLTAKFRQGKDRLQLYTDLEKTQREKLDYERERQQRGRSTLQQVILFENDYELAQLGRIRTLAEVLTLNAQMKLYGVSYESR